MTISEQRAGHLDGLHLNPPVSDDAAYRAGYDQGRADRLSADEAATQAAPGLKWYEWTWEDDPQPDRTWVWNVTLAQQFARHAPKETLRVAQLYPMVEAVAYSEARVQAMQLFDLLNPIIAALLPGVTQDGSAVLTIIDGRHRLELARRQGVARIPVAFLNEAQSAACLLPSAYAARLRGRS